MNPGEMELNYGNNLKMLRNAQGLKQADVAEAFGWSTPQFISNWERGISMPPPETLHKLGALYRVNPNVLAKNQLKINEAKFMEGVSRGKNLY